MGQRIILFRGMNTGGVRAPVAEQRAMAAEMGLGNPRTLLASGNLVVESDRDPARLEGEVEAAMEARFGLKVAVMVRTPEDWRSLIGANPFAGEAAEGGERVEAVGDVLYFWFPNGQGQSAIFKKATPRMLGMGTGRNWNTVLKLGAMVGLSPD